MSTQNLVTNNDGDLFFPCPTSSNPHSQVIFGDFNKTVEITLPKEVCEPITFSELMKLCSIGEEEKEKEMIHYLGKEVAECIMM